MPSPDEFSPPARRYRTFLESAARLRIAEPELFSADPPEPDELAWQSRWFSGEFGRDFTTLSGELVHIVDFGWWNHGAGPDFRDCIVEVSGASRRGSIELDPALRDWEAHGHAANPAYNDTVLHLFLTPQREERFFTRTSQNQEVPQVYLDVNQCDPASGERSAPAHPGRCVQSLASLPESRVLEIMEDAARYRLERKGRRWQRVAGIHGLDQAIYQGIAGALGYSRNQLPMNILAQRLPLRFLQKHPGDTEALLFGAAGFLDGKEVEHGEAATRAWLRGLWESWWKYRAGFTLGRTSQAVRWTLSGTRPVNHPQRRIAALSQIAAHWREIRRLVDASAFHEKTFVTLLESLTHPYWSRHYTLTAKPSSTPLALLGTQRIRDILANLVFPLLVPQREELWKSYLRLPAPVESTRTNVAGLRLFGSREKAEKYASRLWQHQALLQIYEDFCLADVNGCPGCPFPEQVLAEEAPVEFIRNGSP
ncbi:MAG TPA: DUF2851 family protein [Verrucomicrobiales bacterium]|nr:DUF2851 family protein [Verrucomicrobiales bacterium]